MMPPRYDYHGYLIIVSVDQTPPVSVFDPRFLPSDPALYKATSLDLAMKWIDAYRAGAQWAVEARLVVAQ